MAEIKLEDGKYYHEGCPSADEGGGEMNMAVGECLDCGKQFTKNAIKENLSSSLKQVLKGDEAKDTGFRTDWGSRSNG